MAAPLPAPRTPMMTSVLFDGQRVGMVGVGREPKDYEFRVVAGACPGVVEIRSSVWTVSDELAELGVQVHFAGLKTP